MKLKHLLCSALLPLCFFLAPSVATAQPTSRVYLTSTLGQLSPVGSFGDAYQKSLSVTTGIEARIKNSDYYILGSIEFDNVGYSQVVRDFPIQFLIQNTTTPILIISANFGKSFFLDRNRKFFVSPYIGSGYINVSEPRAVIDFFNAPNSLYTAKIEKTYNSGALGRVGSRIGFNTGKVWLPTILLDGSYWRSFNNPYQGDAAQAYTIMIGTRYGF